MNASYLHRVFDSVVRYGTGSICQFPLICGHAHMYNLAGHIQNNVLIVFLVRGRDSRKECNFVLVFARLHSEEKGRLEAYVIWNFWSLSGVITIPDEPSEVGFTLLPCGLL